MAHISDFTKEKLSVDAVQAAGFNELTTCAVLVWHGHWEAAHVYSQAHEGELAFDYLHALQHRLEKDYGNANYWHRRSADIAHAAASAALTKKIADEGWTDENTTAHQQEVTNYLNNLEGNGQ